MEQWRKVSRKEAVITDIDTLVPEDHLLRKIERVMDYEWLYERLDPYFNHEVGRPSIDPDCGMFVKGEHERQFAYEAHTACDRHGYVLGVDVTAGNVHDSVALLRDGSSSSLLPEG